MSIELLRRYQVVDLVLQKKKTTKGYAIQMIQTGVKNGKLIPHVNKLKQGTRSERLYDPVEITRWLETL